MSCVSRIVKSTVRLRLKAWITHPDVFAPARIEKLNVTVLRSVETLQALVKVPGCNAEVPHSRKQGI